jgi:hypothetical protein
VVKNQGLFLCIGKFKLEKIVLDFINCCSSENMELLTKEYIGHDPTAMGSNSVQTQQIAVAYQRQVHLFSPKWEAL